MCKRHAGVLSILLLALFTASKMPAQEAAHSKQRQKDFYIGYGFLSSSFNAYAEFSGTPMNGWDASISSPIKGSMELEGRAMGLYGTNLGALQIEHSLLVGPKISGRSGPVTEFVHGLVGLGIINSGAFPYDNSRPSSNATFAAMVGAGVDVRTSPTVSWRIEGDYLHCQFGSASDQIHNIHGNFAHITTGLVFRF